MIDRSDERNPVRGLLGTFIVGLLGIAVGAGGLFAYLEYFAPSSTESGVSQETSPTSEGESEPQPTADPREALIESVAYQVAVERGLEHPTPQIDAEVHQTVSRLEASYPNSSAEAFRECYRILSQARLYFPDLSLAQLESMLVNEATPARGNIVQAAHTIYDQIEYEYYRPQIEALQARQAHERELNQTIQNNLAVLRERGQAENAARRAALANMGRRTPLEQRWFSDYIASVPRFRWISINNRDEWDRRRRRIY